MASLTVARPDTGCAMGYTTRVLPLEEWPRLAGTEAEPLLPHLDPAQAQVLVVEADGALAGCWVLLRLVHAECVWIAPAHRGKGTVAKRLVRFMRERALAWGARTVIGSATTAGVERLIGKLGGQRLPGACFVLPLLQEGDPAWDGQ